MERVWYVGRAGEGSVIHIGSALGDAEPYFACGANTTTRYTARNNRGRRFSVEAVASKGEALGVVTCKRCLKRVAL